MNGKRAKALRAQARATAPLTNAPYGMRIQSRPQPLDKPQKVPAVLRALNPRSARYHYKQLKAHA